MHGSTRYVGIAVSVALLAGCDSGSEATDAHVADAPVIDAAPDAPTDAALDAPTDAALDAPTDAALDAPTDAALDAPGPTLPDIDGTWLLAIDPRPIAPGTLVQFTTIWDLTVSPTGSLDGSYQPLVTFGVAPDSAGRVPVGAAIIANDTVVDSTGAFSAHLVGTLPADANSISGTQYDFDINLVGSIHSASLVCGAVTGVVGPVTVDGSTYAAIRTANPLPAPVSACP